LAGSVSHWSQRHTASQSPLRLGLLPLPREEFRQLKLINQSINQIDFALGIAATGGLTSGFALPI